MKIKKLIFILVAMAFAAHIFVDNTAKRYLTYESYKDFDRSEIVHRMEMSLNVLNRELFHLDRLNNDWSTWDDTYKFVIGLHPNYVESNLVLTSFTKNDINLIYFVDTDGKILWGKSIDLKSKEPIDFQFFSKGFPPADHPLLSHKGPEDWISGFIATEKGPLLISSHPVVTSHSEGPINASLIMGRLLNNNLLVEVKRQTGIILDFWTISPEKGHFHIDEICPDPTCMFDMEPEDLPDLAVVQEINEWNRTVTQETIDKTMFAYAYMKDFLGENGILFRTKAPMKATLLTDDLFRNSLMSDIIGGLLVLILLLLIINFTVVKPITSLIKHAEKIRSSGSMHDKISPTIHSNDEIKTLAVGIDSMMERLATAQRQLVDQSYFSGMNDVASGVMHNIRNAINPIVADIFMIREELTQLPLKDLKKARREVMDCTDPHRRNRLSKFVDNGLDHFDIIVSDATKRLLHMTNRINTIEKILIELEKFTKAGIHSEHIDLSETINHSRRLLNHVNFSDIKIRIDESLKNIGMIYCDRIALIHIMTNVLNNSVEAIHRTEQKKGRIVVKGKIEEVDKVQCAHITVDDNGPGITDGNLGKIFARGFSTKSKKTSGVGLHWCANTVAALNGTIYAESDGKTGTVMHLILPVDK